MWLLLWWLSSQESTCNAGAVGSILGLGRSPGEGNKCRYVTYTLYIQFTPIHVLKPVSSHVLCLVTQLCPTLYDPMDCSLPGSSVHGDSPDKNTGVDCHALLQRIFPTQGSNPGIKPRSPASCRWILYRLSLEGNPIHVIVYHLIL